MLGIFGLGINCYNILSVRNTKYLFYICDLQSIKHMRYVIQLRVYVMAGNIVVKLILDFSVEYGKIQG